MTITKISVGLNWNVTESVTIGFGTAPFTIPNNPTLTYAGGTGSGMSDLHYESPTITLASGASTTLVLSALTDAQGRAVALAHVRGIAVAVDPTTRVAGDYLTLGSAATHAWTTGPWGSGTKVVFDIYADAAGLTDGWAVGAGATDQLKILNSGTHSMTFSVSLFGTSI